MKLRKVEFVLSAVKPKHYPPADRPEIAFAGRSNVGKSSLLNTLLNRRSLARVSRTPGRTQLINFFDVNDAFYLVDLPGYGYAKVPDEVRRKWGPMMEAYVRSRDTLRAMVVLLDVRRDPSPEDEQLMDALAALEVPMIPVLTKCDKLSNSQVFSRSAQIARALSVPRETFITFSSHTGAGRDALWQVIELALTPDEDHQDDEGDASSPQAGGGPEGEA